MRGGGWHGPDVQGWVGQDAHDDGWFRPLCNNEALRSGRAATTVRRRLGEQHDRATTRQHHEQHHARRDKSHPPRRHRCRRRWQEGGTERNSSGCVIIGKSIGDGMVSAGLRLLLEKIHGYSY